MIYYKNILKVTLLNIFFSPFRSDREMLLKWSYLEASLLLKRYADLLEDVRLYLQTRTSSPGECAFMMEDKL
jgi:hypothetical protein